MPWCKVGKGPSKIGDYEVLGKIGDGGTATVYKARHAATGELVAIKLASEQTAGGPVRRKRFEQEFHVTRNLDHPNLVRPLRLGRADGLPYLVLELVEGQSLGERIEAKGRLPEAEAVRIISEIAGVLEAAHKQRVLHRDIKPDNILLTADGTAKLTDLGLAKDIEATFDLTRPMTGLGTPNFMAPEQFRDAKHADARCDVYGLGATLYMAVTGKLPFQARYPIDVLQKKLDGELTPPGKVVKGLSPAVERAICKAMDVNPLRRHASCQELIDDLTGKGQAPVPVDAPAPPRGQRVDKRASVRYASNQGGFCNAVGGEKAPRWPAKVQNVSADGVALLLGRRFEVRSSLWVELADGAAGRTYLVRVVRVQARPGRKWLLGCTFARRLAEDEVQTLL
jgi:eukaryotic-like serine/threonine-protein kinase